MKIKTTLFILLLSIFLTACSNVGDNLDEKDFVLSQKDKDDIILEIREEIKEEVKLELIEELKEEIILEMNNSNDEIIKSRDKAGANNSIIIPDNMPDFVYMTDNGIVLWYFEFQKIDGVVYLTGVVENLSNNDMKMIEVTFDLYDETGKLLGNTSDFISEIKREKKWSFKAPILVKNVKTANFSSLKGKNK